MRYWCVSVARYGHNTLWSIPRQHLMFVRLTQDHSSSMRDMAGTTHIEKITPENPSLPYRWLLVRRVGFLIIRRAECVHAQFHEVGLIPDRDLVQPAKALLDFDRNDSTPILLDPDEL